MSFPNLPLDLKFDKDLMLISSFKAIVSNSSSLTVVGVERIARLDKRITNRGVDPHL